MNAPLYVSRPAVALPATRVDNDQLMALIRNEYRGEPARWSALEDAIRFILARCNTRVRYFDSDPDASVGRFGARVVSDCLVENGWRPCDVDMLIYGGIARHYFEPATAMEVCARSGIEAVHAFDITSACAGFLDAIHTTCAYFALHPELSRAIVCSAELSHGCLDFDVQQPSDLLRKAAGLTIGNGAAAVAISREPFEGGCLQLNQMGHRSAPMHYGLCRVPINGVFDSRSTELQRLNVLVLPEVHRLLAGVGWTVQDIDHCVFHQPGDALVLDTAAMLGVPSHKVPLTHQFFANTATTTVPFALHHLASEDLLVADDKLVLCTAAAGFTVVTGAGVWVS